MKGTLIGIALNLHDGSMQYDFVKDSVENPKHLIPLWQIEAVTESSVKDKMYEKNMRPC